MVKTLLLASIAFLAILFIFALILRSRSQRNVAYVLRNPRIAFVNFGGEIYEHLVTEDRATLAKHFQESTVARSEVPAADVIFLYADVSSDGAIQGPEPLLRRVGELAGARLVVLATSTKADAAMAALHRGGAQFASLVVTLERSGAEFSTFFDKLFARMASGMQMAIAWNDISPQVPGQHRPNSAQLIYLTDGAAVSFEA